MRLISWNVNGLRAVIKKDFIPVMLAENPDVICLQETKAQDEQVREALLGLDGFHLYCSSAIKKGYSGTALLTREQPLAIRYGLDIEEHDKEGRVIAAEFTDFILVTVYTPNSGSELKRLSYRQHWDRDFLRYIKQLEKKKPVVLCGDLNVAHTDIDLARPKENYNRSAGYMQEEIDGINKLLAADFTDSYRFLHPEGRKYTWWSFRAGARPRDVGWRIDYFLASQNLQHRFKHADCLTHIHGSDHCPVLLELA